MDFTHWRHSLRQFDVLFLTALLWFMAKFLRYVFPPLFEPLQGTYQVSTAVLGAGFTGFMLAYAAMQLPSGLLADAYGSIRVITAGALLGGLASLVIAVAAPLGILLGAMIVIGVGTGAHKTVAVRLLSRQYPAQTGRALGILDTIGAIGGIVAPVAVVVVLAGPRLGSDSWRTLFLVAGMISIILGILFAHRFSHRPADAKSATSTESTSRQGLGTYRRLFSQPNFVLFVVVTIIFSFSYNGVVAFLPLYLGQEIGLPTATVGLLYSLLFVATFIQLLTGEAGDRFGMIPIIAVTLSIASIGLLGLVLVGYSGGLLTTAILIICIGIGSHGYRPVRGAYLASIIPHSMTGGGLGFVRTLLMGAGAIAPLCVGLVAELIGFHIAFWGLTVTMGVAALLVIPLFYIRSQPETRVIG